MNCPQCGSAMTEGQAACPQCRRGTRRTIKRPLFPAPPSPDAGPTTMRRARETRLNLPRRIDSSRYCFGPTWTSGWLYLVPEGIFFLSEKDGFQAQEEIAKLKPTADDSFLKIATLSFYCPEKKIEKIFHSSAINAYFMVTAKKVPVRLPPEGWDLVDLYATMLGIKIE